MGNKTTFKLLETLNAMNATNEQCRMKTARLQRLFNQFDSGNKGWLNKADIAKMGCKARRQNSDFLDGQKNPMELILWAPSLVSRFIVRNKRFQAAFDELDADDDGRISREEFVLYFLQKDDWYEQIILALD
jgi:Ca2+-binding EF-hand superfamily protein